MDWVLVMFTPETDEVEVFGPWNNVDAVDAANDAARAKHRMLASEGKEDSVRMAVAPIKPMVYYQPD